MAGTAGRAVIRSQGRRPVASFGLPRIPSRGASRPVRRHPLVAAVMVLPLATLLTVVFGGWEAVVTQASSVVGLLGR